MADIQLSAAHLGRVADSLTFEPQRANNGFIVFEGLHGWLYPSQAIAASSQVVLALDSFPLPEDENAVLDVHYMNEVHKVASKARTAAMEIVVKDFVDMEVALILQRWRRMVYNPSSRYLWDVRQAEPDPGGFVVIPPKGGLGLARNYKKDGAVHLVAPDGSTTRSFGIQGCWPSRMSPGSIDMASEEQVKITLELQVDRITYGRMEPRR